MNKKVYIIYFIIFIGALTLTALSTLDLINSDNLNNKQILSTKFRLASNVATSIAMLFLMYHLKKKEK